MPKQEPIMALGQSDWTVRDHARARLRANVCNFRESADSREFFNFFIFCPNNLYSALISKLTLKLVTAFYFFPNRAKFEKTLNRRSFEYEISEN